MLTVMTAVYAVDDGRSHCMVMVMTAVDADDEARSHYSVDDMLAARGRCRLQEVQPAGLLCSA